MYLPMSSWLIVAMTNSRLQMEPDKCLLPSYKCGPKLHRSWGTIFCIHFDIESLVWLFLCILISRSEAMFRWYSSRTVSQGDDLPIIYLSFNHEKIHADGTLVLFYFSPAHSRDQTQLCDHEIGQLGVKPIEKRAFFPRQLSVFISSIWLAYDVCVFINSVLVMFRTE